MTETIKPIKQSLNNPQQEVNNQVLKKEDPSEMFFEEKPKEPTKFVKVTKIKENLTKFTPTYQTPQVSNSNDFYNQKSVLDENDLKTPELIKIDVNKDKLSISKNVIEHKEVDLSGVKTKIDNHLVEMKKEEKLFEEDWEKLNQQFNQLSGQMNKDMGEFRQKVIELKSSKRKQDIEEEVIKSSELKNLYNKLNDKKTYK